jgi:hypothetical protein
MNFNFPFFATFFSFLISLDLVAGLVDYSGLATDGSMYSGPCGRRTIRSDIGVQGPGEQQEIGETKAVAMQQLCGLSTL